MIKYKNVPLLMKFKSEVNISMLYSPVVAALPIIKKIFVEVINPRSTPICTSFEEGIHGENSFHPKGLALDLSCRYYADKKQEMLAVKLNKALKDLDPHWQVILEFDEFNSEGEQIKWGHLHLEFDINLEVC